MNHALTTDRARRKGVWENGEGFLLRAPDGAGYPVDIGEDILDPENPLLADHLKDRRVCVFAGPTVDRLYGERMRAYLRAHLPAEDWAMTTVPGTERSKSLATVEWACAFARQAGLDRHGMMVALGGGVTTDTIGFAASIYARGVDYVKVNTSLVGQVDAGVGIKTGVNGIGVKNMLGTYHVPYGSINDCAFLATVGERELRCGLAEIVKIAAVRDAELFRTIEQEPRLFVGAGRPRIGDAERHVVRRSIRLMLEELCDNLYEADKARIVDFGHTFGPVIETASGYRVAHGESVAIDMAISAQIARIMGVCDDTTCERILGLLTRAGLPIFDAQTCTPEHMRAALVASWERRGRRLNLVLPVTAGRTLFLQHLEELPDSLLTEALDTLREQAGVGTGRPAPPAPAPAPVPNLDRDLMTNQEAAHGGRGTLRVHRPYDAAVAREPVAFIDLVVVPPAATIGLHRHGDNHETYTILDGTGVMELDGAEFPVGPGDVIANGPFGEHGLRNESSVPLRLLVVETAPEPGA